MAFLAGITDSLRFGTAVLVLPQRHPMLLAKQLATIDVLSGGRAELGIGAGWLADEFDALGYSFTDRGPHTDEPTPVSSRDSAPPSMTPVSWPTWGQPA